MGKDMEDETSQFDLKLVYDSFSNCKKEDGTISLDSYIEGYTELSKFFNLFGSVFHFVVNDVKEKLGILRTHRQSEAGPNFISVQSMVNYEVTNNLTTSRVHNGKTPSGSRTLLRLHRAMEFIIDFMRKLPTLQESDRMSGIASEAYNGTLSRYHGWLLRKGVALALYTLPTAGQLVERMGAESSEEVLRTINQVVQSAQPVYDTVHKVYDEHDLLDLP